MTSVARPSPTERAARSMRSRLEAGEAVEHDLRLALDAHSSAASCARRRQRRQLQEEIREQARGLAECYSAASDLLNRTLEGDPAADGFDSADAAVNDLGVKAAATSRVLVELCDRAEALNRAVDAALASRPPTQVDSAWSAPSTRRRPLHAYVSPTHQRLRSLDAAAGAPNRVGSLKVHDRHPGA